MLFYTLVLQFHLKNRQKKKRRWHFSEQKKTEKKIKNSATTRIYVDGKGTFFR